MTESLTDKIRRRRRDERRNWTVEDEREWLATHPEDQPLEGLESAAQPEPESIEHDEDLVPEMDDAYERTEEDEEIDQVLGRLGIVQAYNKWSNKGSVDPRRLRPEGTKVRCPNPVHPDQNPSAWLNTEKDVYHCGACEQGGDKFDIAAWYFGFDVPGYKKGKDFVELRKKMAESLGYKVTHSRMTGKTYITKDEPPSPENEGGSGPDGDETAVAPATSDDTAPAPVTPLVPDDDDDDVELMPSIDWRSMLGDDTFLRRWMEVTSKDDLPEEYYFWMGLMMIGLAVGPELILGDSPPVKGNMFVVLLGPSGIGKSRSINAMNNLLREALPFDKDDPTTTGTYLMPSPGSAEALIDMFVNVHTDPVTDEPYFVPVRGLIRFDELSTLISRSERSGNPLKPTLMELFDSYGPVEHRTRGFGSVKAHDHFASCVTTTQVKSIRNLVQGADVDSGFLNRWLFVGGKGKTLTSYGRQDINIQSCVQPLQQIRSNAGLRSHSGNNRMELSGDALQAWDEFFHRTLVPIKTSPNGDNDIFVRADLHIKKIVTLLAIDRSEVNPSLRTVQDAISLWRYIESMYALVSGNIDIDKGDEVSSHVLAAIQKWTRQYGRAPSIQNIMRLFKQKNKKHSLQETTRAIKLLEESRYIEEKVHKPKRGPATTVYALVDEE